MPETVSSDLISKHPSKKLNSFWDVLEESCKNWGSGHCLGTRETVNGERGEYKWKSYDEVRQLVQACGSGLVNLELCPEEEFDIPSGALYSDKLRFIGINSKNREEWTIMDIASNAFGITSVPLYDTLGDEAAEFIISTTRLQTICADSDCVDKLLKLTEQLSGMKYIVCFDTITEAQQSEADSRSVRLVPFSDVVKKGKADLKEPVTQTEDFAYTICYTSGTTGLPKGVVLSNKSIRATCAGALGRPDMFKAYPGDYHISYLPMAHVYERVAQYYLILQGAAIGFYSGNTLKLVDDIKSLRPTIFLSVPRLYNRILDKVMSGVAAKGGIARRIFSAALKSKLYNYKTDGRLRHGLYDKIAFKKVQQTLGGRVRILVTGSAPLNYEVQQKAACLFSCNILEGWGMTETCAISACQGEQDFQKGNVGGICGSLEFRLESVPDMNYCAENIERPRGELCVRGPSLFCGYFMNETESKNSFDDDGWFRTGDVAEILPNGALRIIDRKKNIYKLAQGEYVAPEKIEGVYQQAHLISQIFAYGDSEKHCMVAIVVPDEDAVMSWAVQHRMSNVSFADIVKEKPLTDDILLEMNSVAKDKLKGFEKVKAICLSHEPFTVDNGLLTTTFKIVRHKIKIAYQQQLVRLYAELGDS
eukprot:GHVQ01027372.1.p1 GENE.GHVQ01027372.1~~GHVQ01027372.1.p1  ORF type:complete len:647 (+),score=60.20 GHVQ01027372.1:371-2311(+)